MLLLLPAGKPKKLLKKEKALVRQSPDSPKLPGAIREKVMSFSQGPGGMVLLSGPAGAGKKAVLYCLAEMLDLENFQAYFIDSSLCKRIPGMNHVSVPRAQRKRAVDSILRHDSDLMVLPDLEQEEEEAARAVDAARSGRLVLASSQEEMPDPGGLPWLAIHQRALQKLCPHCARPFRSTKIHRQKLAQAFPKFSASLPDTLYKGRGCKKCSGGYSGSVGMFATGENPQEALLGQAMKNIRCATTSLDELLLLASC
jgi:type IV pilus assembly protein PilB